MVLLQGDLSEELVRHRLLHHRELRALGRRRARRLLLREDAEESLEHAPLADHAVLAAERRLLERRQAHLPNEEGVRRLPNEEGVRACSHPFEMSASSSSSRALDKSPLRKCFRAIRRWRGPRGNATTSGNVITHVVNVITTWRGERGNVVHFTWSGPRSEASAGVISAILSASPCSFDACRS